MSELREKVIKGLECCCCQKDGVLCVDLKCPYFNASDDCSGVVMRYALKLLKEREPLEPVIIAGQYECGECRYELRADADSYCPCCGRKVKWDD